MKQQAGDDMGLIHMDSQVDPVGAIERLPGLVETGQSADDLITACLDLLVDIGFDRARFYEIDEHDPDDGAICVLTHQRPDANTRLHGYTIPLGDTALQRLGGGKTVVLANHNSMNPAPAWQYDLRLRDRVSVDIPVAAGGRVLGLLAADCEPGRLTLNERGSSVLRALGAVAGSAASSISVKSATPSREAPDTDTTPDEYAGYAGQELAAEVDAEIAAVFRYDWRRDRLEKIWQRHTGRSVAVEDFPERYAIGEGLTGSAWADPRLRYIPDLEKLQRNRPNLVSQESLNWHSSLLDHEVKTVLYTVLGRTEGRYLVRVFNRRRDPLLPFLNLRSRFSALSEVLSI
jgi:hypothetical protein